MANRYWVGGAGTWSSSLTTNWSSSSGGAGGASAPTSADSVYFDSNSGSGAVTFSAGTCLDCNILSGTSVTFASGGSVINVYGNWTNTANISMGTGQTVIFTATGAVTLTPQTGTFDNAIFNGAGGTFNLASNMTVITQTNLTRGTLAPGAYTFSTGNFVVVGTNPTGIIFTGATPGIYLTGDNTSVLTYYYNNTTLTGTVYFKLTNNSTTGARTVTVNSSSTGGSALSIYVDAGSDTINLRGTSGTYSRLNSFSTTTGSFTGTVDIAYALEVFGNFALKSGNTWSNSGGTAAIKMKGTGGGNVFNSNGISLGSTPIYFDGVGGSWTLYGAVSTTSTVYLLNGSLDANGQSISSGAFSTTGTGTRALTLGSSTWTITGSATAWTVSGTGFTGSLASSVIAFSSSSAAKTLATLSSVTYGEVKNSGSTSLTLGAATYTSVTATGSGLPSTIQFTASATTYVGSLGNGGGSSSRVAYKSTSAGTQATLSKASGTVNLSYADLQDLNATGGTIWLAYTSNGNTDNGGNTGWVFNSGTGNFMAFF